MSGHSANHYFKVYAILVVLFLVSYVVPEMTHYKPLVLASAFGIAVVKAWMVAAYFMHLKHERTFVGYILITALAFMFLLYVALMPDIQRKEGHHWRSNIVVEVPEDHHGGHGAPHHDVHAEPVHEAKH